MKHELPIPSCYGFLKLVRPQTQSLRLALSHLVIFALYKVNVYVLVIQLKFYYVFCTSMFMSISYLLPVLFYDLPIALHFAPLFLPYLIYNVLSLCPIAIFLSVVCFPLFTPSTYGHLFPELVCGILHPGCCPQ